MLQNHTWMPLLLLPATLSVGCSKEDLTGTLDKAKSAVTENAAKAKEAVQAKVESTTETVQEQLNLAGSIELTAGEIVKTDACYASFIRQGAGRPNVLQLQSYRDAEREAFPSVFLQVQVQANSIAELVGEPLSARLFVQRDAQGPILFSDVTSPVQLTVTAFEEQLISVEINAGEVRDTSTGSLVPVSGKLTGVVQ